MSGEKLLARRALDTCPSGREAQHPMLCQSAQQQGVPEEPHRIVTLDITVVTTCWLQRYYLSAWPPWFSIALRKRICDSLI